VAVGDDHDRGVAGRAGEQLGDLVGVDGRAVAGDEQRALGAALEGGVDPAAHGRGLADLLRVVHDRRAGLFCGSGGERLGGHHYDIVDLGDGGQRGQHVGHHRGRELLAIPAADHVAKPLLGSRE
jgi:hypothetical protein